MVKGRERRFIMCMDVLLADSTSVHLQPSSLNKLLETKEAGKRHKDSSNTSTGFIVQEGALWRGSPARKLEPTGTYRLGVVIGEWSGRETPLGGKILLEWNQPLLGDARRDMW
jgi:hypothetical protein